MVADSTEKYCIRLLLLVGDKVNPTYEVSIGDNFGGMSYERGATFLENATITSQDDWFVVEGDVLKHVVWKYEKDDKLTKKEMEKKFRNPYDFFYPVENGTGDIIGTALYSTTGIVYLKETSHEKFTFKHAIFREFMNL